MAGTTVTEFLILNTPFVYGGLGQSTANSLTFQMPAVPAAGIYRVSLQTTFLPGTSLAVVVQQNGSTVFTAPTPSPTQSAIQFQYDLNCAISDTVAVVLTSSNQQDLVLNNIVTTCQIMNGP